MTLPRSHIWLVVEPEFSSRQVWLHVSYTEPLHHAASCIQATLSVPNLNSYWLGPVVVGHVLLIGEEEVLAGHTSIFG